MIASRSQSQEVEEGGFQSRLLGSGDKTLGLGSNPLCLETQGTRRFIPNL